MPWRKGGNTKNSKKNIKMKHTIKIAALAIFALLQQTHAQQEKQGKSATQENPSKEKPAKWTSSRADGHAPIGVMGDHVHKQGEWMFSYRYMSMDMEGNLKGTDEISNSEIHETYMVAPQNMKMKMHMLGAMFAPSDRLTLMVMTHILNNDIVSPNPHIVIELNDENPFLILNEDMDTANFQIEVIGIAGLEMLHSKQIYIDLVEELRASRLLKREDSYRISIKLELPTSQGFGMSAAGLIAVARAFRVLTKKGLKSNTYVSLIELNGCMVPALVMSLEFLLRELNCVLNPALLVQVGKLLVLQPINRFSLFGNPMRVVTLPNILMMSIGNVQFQRLVNVQSHVYD